MEEDNPPGKEDEPPEQRSDRAEPSTPGVDATAIETKTKKGDGAVINPVLPILNHTPVKQLPKGNLTPDGRKYRLLHDELKVKYRELHAKNQDIQEKLKKSEDLLEKFAIENESLRQEKEVLENRFSQETPDSRPAVMKMNNADIFIIKPKKSTKNPAKPSTETCAISGCENNNSDLIKCNICGNAICEDCSSVKITKLRPIMNQCSTLYFICKCCDVAMREKEADVYDQMKSQITAQKTELECCERQNEKLSVDANATQKVRETCFKLTDENKAKSLKIDELQESIRQKNLLHSGCNGQINNLKQQTKTLTDHQESLRILLEERESSLHDTETKLVSLQQTSNTNPASERDRNIEELINQRFDKIDKNIDALIEKKLAGSASNSQPSEHNGSNKSFSAVVGGPTINENAVTAMVTSRNAEILEKQEQEKRINNIIIYGVTEQRVDDNVSIQEHDKEFFTSLLEAIDINVTPKQITRLGKEQAGKTRPVKVVLKSVADKGKIMSSLNKLKNVDEPIRGISVRDDYTIEERQLIKSMAEEAKRKNDNDNVTHWKVRGTPKNGLKVVKITTRK